MGLQAPPPLRFGSPSMPIKQKQTAPKTTPIKLPAKRKATTTSSSIAKFRRSTTSQPLARKLTLTRSTSLKKKPARKSVSSRSTSKKTEKQPRLARKPLSKESLNTFDGKVSEAEHVMCHAGSKRFCIRCDIHQRAKSYEACSWHDGQSWLKRGVDSRGVWGLGCMVCAKFIASSAGRGTCHSRFSKFAKFEFRETVCRFRVKFLIEQHQKSKSHRMAYYGVTKNKRHSATPPPPPLPQPLACPPTPCDEVVEPPAEDVEMLQGNVPSPAEWKDAWAVVSETISLRKEARVFVKKTSAEAFMVNRRRKRHRKQLVVMAEVLRRQIRNVFRQATSISLALDECKYRKIIRFRADLPVALSSELRHVGASGFSLSGVLGILDCSKKHASDFEEDHALTALKQLDGFLVKFCTPLGRAGKRQPCDEELRNKLLRAVTCIAADGASKERRAVLLAARELFPNVVIVIRDPAHAIRISCFKALHSDDVFEKVWHELFDGRHALVPDLMNSDKWHNLLTAIQEDNVRAVAMPAVQGQQQPLARIIRNIAFAKQRFDSTAGPVGKIALMLLPVATLLAYIASDRRHDRPQRDRADALLRKLDSKFCTAIGLSADWGIICTWFLRLFDVANHDIAKSRSEIDCMIETLDAVFLEGRVFQQLLAPAAAAASGASGSTEPLPPSLQAAGQEFGFITGKVMRDLRHKYVFYASGYPVLLWGEPSAADKQELLHRLQNVASLTKERLRADFPLNDVRSALAIFDRRLVRKAFGPSGDSKVRTFLLRSVRHLSGVLGCDEAAAVLQYNSVIPYMIQEMAPSSPLAGVTNQQAWALLLDDDYWEKACPKRLRGASLALRRLIRFYISIEDGECTVERDLGEFRNQMREHRSADLIFHDDCLVLRLNGPRSAAEFDVGGGSRNNLTSFSRECASLWRELYGKKRGHFNATAVSAASKKRQTAGTFRGTMRGVLAAARLAVAARRRAKSSSSPSSVALHAGAGTTDSALWNGQMTKFQSRSRKNIPGVTQTRAYPGGAFMNPAGVSLAPYRAAAKQPLARPRLINKVALLGVTGVCVREAAVVSGRHCCAEADLVIVPDISIFHDVPALTANEDLAISLLYIVLLGLEVATTTQLSASNGKPRSIPTASCQRHVPAMLQKMVFCLGARLVI